MVIHVCFLPKAHELQDFPSSLRGQQRASSAQSLPAPEPLAAALPPPQSLLLLSHPQVLHVKPQPAPWNIYPYFPLSLFAQLPALTHISLPSSSPAGHQKKGLLEVKKVRKATKKLWFLGAARGGL